jgi:hypothetical protein
MAKKKIKQLSISFAANSRKKSALMFRENGRFISRKEYLTKTGITESQISFAAKSVIEPAQNERGQLLKKDKKAVAKMFSSFINEKNRIPEEYTLKINICSYKSIEALAGKDIFLTYKGMEYKFSFNDFVYFCGQFLEQIEGNVFYMFFDAVVNDPTGEAHIILSKK